MAAKKSAKVKVARPRVTIEELDEFVRTYQAAESLAEIATALDWTVEKVRSQATRLRKRGVPLKKITRKTDLTSEDIENLAKHCEAS